MPKQPVKGTEHLGETSEPTHDIAERESGQEVEAIPQPDTEQAETAGNFAPPEAEKPESLPSGELSGEKPDGVPTEIEEAIQGSQFAIQVAQALTALSTEAQGQREMLTGFDQRLNEATAILRELGAMLQGQAPEGGNTNPHPGLAGQPARTEQPAAPGQPGVWNSLSDMKPLDAIFAGLGAAQGANTPPEGGGQLTQQLSLLAEVSKVVTAIQMSSGRGMAEMRKIAMGGGQSPAARKSSGGTPHVSREMEEGE